jgi:broad specificity phosphatase PhoE
MPTIVRGAGAAIEEFEIGVTTSIYLVRHAPHADVGQRLSGRSTGLGLTPEGVAQAERLAARFGGVRIDAVQSSPIQRATQTALPLAHLVGCDVEPVEALTEIDFGDWTGQAFDALEGDPRWRAWNEHRSEGECPGGESMRDAKSRVVDHLFAAGRRGGGAVAMVTHCDIIRAAVAHVLGLSLDHVHRFEVAPASVTHIVIEGEHARLVQLNERVS